VAKKLRSNFLKTRILQLLVAILILPTGFICISWLNAKSSTDVPLPNGWKAGVMSHGEYYNWPLGAVREHPVAFAVCCILLIAEVVFLISSAVLQRRELR
jgi:hypothetical protein